MKQQSSSLKPSSVRMASFLILAGLAGGIEMNANPAERLMLLERPLVIAHRGYSILAPENTLAALEMGVVAAADLVELDYYASSDGVAIVFHDATLDRTTDAIAQWGEEGLTVSSKTARALQSLDVGSWFSPSFASERMPLLTEALDLIQGKGGVTLIERKEGTAEQCVEILRGRGLVNEVVVQAFDWEYIASVHELLPEQVLGALGPPRVRDGRRLSSEERALSRQWVDEAKASGARVVGWNSQVSADSVAYAHSVGMKVWVYTINDALKANELLNMGVDGFITDNTSLIWRVLAEKR